MKTGGTACVLSIDEKNKKLYFANCWGFEGGYM